MCVRWVMDVCQAQPAVFLMICLIDCQDFAYIPQAAYPSFRPERERAEKRGNPGSFSAFLPNLFFALPGQSGMKRRSSSPPLFLLLLQPVRA